MFFIHSLARVIFADFKPTPTCNVSSSYLCDGMNDCGDWSDESGCGCGGDYFQCACYQSDNGCTGWRGCVHHWFVCDGINDCGDWSDESGCKCRNGDLECACYQSAGGCTERRGCINRRFRCNGINDCGDWSDETGCKCTYGKFECDCYQSDDGCTGREGCILQYEVCNEYNSCGDWSDEAGCKCPVDEFECDCYQSDDGCAGSWGCVLQSRVCDGRNDCGDWSDEKYCLNTNVYCRNDECVERSKVNNGIIDMTSGYDENICCASHGHKCGCIPGNDNCTTSGKCIPNIWIGDAKDDCNTSHSDEPCEAIKIWCHKCQIIINRCSTNKGKSFLLQNSNENTTTCHSNNLSFHHLNLSTKWICISSLCGKCLGEIFQCENGHVIDNIHYCDTKLQCDDGSDEQKQSFGFRCSGKSRSSVCVLPQQNLYESTPQCADGSDICFVDGEFRCFLCLDKKLIVSPKQVCDQYIDCYDGSDELLCSNQSVAQALLGDEGSRCPPGQMHCNSSTECVAMDKVLCNFSVECKDKVNQRFCHHQQRSSSLTPCWAMLAKSIDIISVLATRCDNRPECSWMEDECESQCDPRPSFCDDECGSWSRTGYGNRVCDGYINLVRDWSNKCSREVEENCSMRFPCKSKEMMSIDVRYYCDGIFHCDDHSDETNSDCLNKRFNCTTAGDAISISNEFVCDGIKDCNQGEDESRQLCGEKRFYCESGKPISIDKKFVQNGIKDCDTGLDECKTLFSDKYEMIANPVLRSLFWVMGFLALTGNLATNILTLMEMVFDLKRNNSLATINSFTKLANRFLIFNLTISDFLMGFYLLAVVGQGVRYSGVYCFFDKEWRSSNLCSILGTVAVLSSESSAFIMASMSTLRLVSIYKPFLTRTMKLKWIVFVGILCWVFSLLFAFLPWIPLKSGYFVSQVWFPNHFFNTDTISKDDLIAIANKVSDKNSTHQSWSNVKNTILREFEYNKIKAEFGFYSQTSVCMPRFYASTSESAWEYSTFLITLNFVLFIYMVVVYALVYKKATGTNFSTASKKESNQEIQKRISRLLLTDFFCWIPICIMAYLNVAGVPLPPDAYIASAGLLLPINSAMNPLLYSPLFGQFMSRARNCIRKNVLVILPRHVDDTTEVEVTVEQTALQEIQTNYTNC